MLRQLGIAALIIGATVACDRPAEPPERPPAAEGEPPNWVTSTCPGEVAAANPLRKGGIPADLTTVAVVRCHVEIRQIPGEGAWRVEITERVDTPVPDLVDMLRRPSDSTPPGTACATPARILPYFLLIDAEGKALLPTVPIGICGQPRDEVATLLEALPFRPVTETRLSRVE